MTILPPRPANRRDLPKLAAAVDFGISNTDVVVRRGDELITWSQPYTRDPDEASVVALLAARDVDLSALSWLAVTGGRHRVLPDALRETAIVKISEVQAIGRGGQARLGLEGEQRTIPLMVASCGSGTALIKAQGDHYAHVSGSAVGGGAMLGLARLILGTMNPLEIERLAAAGDRNAVDLSLADVITGPIGSLPADATAVNFGRLGRSSFHGDVSREDLAAALVNLIGQTIALITINVARAQACAHIVLIGHMLDMATLRGVIALVGQYYAAELQLVERPGYATAIGALLLAEHQTSQ
ncbi:MAG: Fumble domain-containing protein [Caldilineaceae bacterium]|jgi:type II pantothenate kinase|nr:Fumble domain-containing protein [Caldilineaceae bacterium]